MEPQLLSNVIEPIQVRSFCGCWDSFAYVTWTCVNGIWMSHTDPKAIPMLYVLEMDILEKIEEST